MKNGIINNSDPVKGAESRKCCSSIVFMMSEIQALRLYVTENNSSIPCGCYQPEIIHLHFVVLLVCQVKYL
jgi:hypothetical protein